MGTFVPLKSFAQAQTLTTLYNFKGNPDGGLPFAGVAQDQSGNLYGTTPYRDSDNGVVYEVTPSGVETVLYSFGYLTGANPFSPVIRDFRGNLYGTTSDGGASGQGTIFVIDTTGRVTVVHNFAGGTTDGCYPSGGLVMDNPEPSMAPPTTAALTTMEQYFSSAEGEDTHCCIASRASMVPSPP